MHRCGGEDGWLGTLASQAPGLTSLRFDFCNVGTVPQEVAGLCGLRELGCVENRLSELPVGPYLTGGHNRGGRGWGASVTQRHVRRLR